MQTIQLTKGKAATVDDVDSDLAALSWYTHNTGYACRNERNGTRRCTIMMHRVILGRILGRDLLPSEQADHKDRDRTNNQRSNIRLATSQQNAANRGAWAAGGIKGVTPHRRKWRARIHIDGKQVDLGLFPTKEEAAAAYNTAAQRQHGVYAGVNPL